MATALAALLLLGAVGWVAMDATHPTLSTDTCTVLGQGLAAGPYKSGAPYLYRNGSNPLHDLALDCKVIGRVWLNEPNPYGLITTQPGKIATLSTKTYHFMPKQWRITVQR